jgi:hypothetical protein
VNQRSKKEFKRYNLGLPEELDSKLREKAAEHNTTVADLIRKSVRCFLMILDAQQDPDSKFLLEQKGHITQIMIF